LDLSVYQTELLFWHSRRDSWRPSSKYKQHLRLLLGRRWARPFWLRLKESAQL